MNPIKVTISGFVVALAYALALPAWADIDIGVNIGGPPKPKIEVLQGQDFTIALPTQGRPDFAWRLVDSSDKVQLTQAARCAPREFKGGACQADHWTFQALSKGHATLRFQYANVNDATQVAQEAAFDVKIHD